MHSTIKAVVLFPFLTLGLLHCAVDAESEEPVATSSEQALGAVCTANSQCPNGSYCNRPGCTATGRCRATLAGGGCFFTIDGSRQVCACNGRTFASADCARKNGNSIAYEGPCL